MKIEYYKPAFFALLVIFIIWFYVDYEKDASTKAKVLRLAGHAERFNSEDWRHVVPAVKEVTLELRTHLGLELPGDAAAKAKAESDAKAKEEADRQAAKEARQQKRRNEVHSQVIGAIQLAIAPTPAQFSVKKADPLSVRVEYANEIEQEIHRLYPDCTEAQCAAISVSARSYLSARGKGLADDVVDRLLEGYHSDEDCPCSNDEPDGDRE